MRKLIWCLSMVKPKHARSIGDLPAKRKATVMHKLAYKDAVGALNKLQSNEATIQKSAQHPTTAFQKSLLMPRYLQAVGVQMSDIDDLKVIHVAGTKGKGSTCAFVESVLRHHGYKTGLYTSPHLVAVRERIRINGRPLSEDLFAKYFWEVYTELKVQEAEEMWKMPAYFMFLTIMAFKVFVIEQVDVLVLEVGVGGEYDCTNVVRHPAVVGITSLGLDHTRLLGSTIEEIAWQKAGIMKKGSPAFSTPQPEGAFQVLQDRAVERGCTLSIAPPLLSYEWEVSQCRLGIPGEQQQCNASLALQLCRSWLQNHSSTGSKNNVIQQPATNGVRKDLLQHHYMPSIATPFSVSKTMAKGLEDCCWPGRCQVMPLGPGMTLFLDGAHTSESVQYCLRWFREASKTEACSLNTGQVCQVLLFNCMGDRRPEMLLTYLADHPFHMALFVPNRLTLNKSTYSDQSNFSVETTTETSRCEANMRVWCHLMSSLEEEDIYNGQEPHVSLSGAAPEDSCLVFPCISQVMVWLEQQRLAAQASFPPCHIQVLVTGSLHLVGGVMSHVDPDLIRSYQIKTS